VRLDHIAITLRMREPWEAIDLGTVMLRAWWRPVYSAWLAIVLPIFLALQLVFINSPWIALILLWWLKPLYDRVVLHVLSQAVFGAPPGVRATLAGLATLVRSSGFLGALTWRRLDPVRSFNLPVRQLEGQVGTVARARERLLGRRAAGQATGLLYACMAFEIVLVLSLNTSRDLIMPAGMASGSTGESWFATMIGIGDDGVSAHLRNLFYFLAVCAIEPLYVASGFALYLNRRTAIEAWDLELAFRRMQHEPEAGSRILAVTLVGTALVCMLGAMSPSAGAAESASDSRTVIREVLADPDFQEFQEKRVWRSRHEAPQKNTTSSRPFFMDLLTSLAEALSQLSRVAAYLILGVALALILIYLVRTLRHWSSAEPRPKTEHHAPQTLFGLDVRPESLPDNIAELAASLATHDPRSALSLLYRGALATLIHRDGLAIENGDTEGDCLRRVRTTRDADLAAYFAHLVGAWSQAAYAGRSPDSTSIRTLCADWAQHFRLPVRRNP
jgi:hypothetical protein